MNIITLYFFSVMAVAGVAVIWRNWLEDHQAQRQALKARLPRVLFKALTCGSCFTYWAALAFVGLFDPLTGLFGQGVWHVLISWMAVAMGSVFMRFSYVLVQERVHDIVHARDRHEQHDDAPQAIAEAGLK